MPHMPTYGDVDPPRGFQALVQALHELGQDDPYSMGWTMPSQLDVALTRVRNEFARLAKSYSYLADPAGKDIWQPLRLALAPSGRRYVLRGDCEDAILTLIVYLLAVGIPRGAMTIVMCHIQEPGEEPRGHAVLAIETTETTLICDFLLRDGEGDIQPWDAPVFRGELLGYNARYEWISRQQPGQSAWVSCVEPPTLDQLIPEETKPMPEEEMFVVCLNLHARAAGKTIEEAEQLAANRLALAGEQVAEGHIPRIPGVEFFKNHGGGGGPCEPRFRDFALPANGFGLPEARPKG